MSNQRSYPATGWNVGYLRITGVVLHSWLAFAITALIERVAINLRAEPVAGFALLNLRADWFILSKTP
ncbi:MAG TPA: hypothetical protein VIS99_13860 [Terrimicrobiaceae bacterium]